MPEHTEAKGYEWKTEVDLAKDAFLNSRVDNRPVPLAVDIVQVVDVLLRLSVRR